MPREVLVVASVCASFVIHLLGFVAILLVLRVSGTPIALAGLPGAIALYLPLFAGALGVALACAAIQVFVRDLVQALGQVLPLLMFGAPIFYDRTLLPERMQGLLDLNPFTFYAESFRSLLLGYGHFDLLRLGFAVALAAGVLLAGHWLFRRLDRHFEDFL
jgi:lipopolysaccharide transport system permease protein